MKTAAGVCVATAFALMATVGAQTPTSTTAGQSNPGNKSEHDVTLTGCLARGGNGGYMLNNARMDSSTSSTTTAGATTTGATTTAGGTTTTTAQSATSTKGGAPNAPAMTWSLAGGTDLDKHVGHKVQVTGKTSWDTSMDHARTPEPGATSTTGATRPAAGGATSTESGRRGQRDEPRVDVQSVKMISSSCS